MLVAGPRGFKSLKNTGVKDGSVLPDRKKMTDSIPGA